MNDDKKNAGFYIRVSTHWDMVKMMTDEYNGDNIIIDDELILRKWYFYSK